jgi:hypothetical protein
MPLEKSKEKLKQSGVVMTWRLRFLELEIEKELRLRVLESADERMRSGLLQLINRDLFNLFITACKLLQMEPGVLETLLRASCEEALERGHGRISVRDESSICLMGDAVLMHCRSHLAEKGFLEAAGLLMTLALVIEENSEHIYDEGVDFADLMKTVFKELKRIYKARHERKMKAALFTLLQIYSERRSGEANLYEADWDSIDRN